MNSAVALPGEHNTPPREKAVASTPARPFGRKPRWVNIREMTESDVESFMGKQSPQGQ